MSSEWNHPHAGDSGVSTHSATAPKGGAKPGQWSVSTRSIGEVLTTEIRCDQLRLLLFAKPAEETARQIESRLEDLLASERVEDYPDTGAVPAPLQHAVDILLDLVDEVEAVTQRRAGALALFQSPREVACACVGGGEPDVWAHEVPFDAPWITLRESVLANDPTPRARGFSLFARPDLEMRLRWPYLLGTPRPEGVVVDARWQAPRGFEVTVREIPVDHAAHGHVTDTPEEPAAAYAAGANETRNPGPRGATDGDSRGDFFAGWFDDIGSEGPRSESSLTHAHLADVEQFAGEDEFTDLKNRDLGSARPTDTDGPESPIRPLPPATVEASDALDAPDDPDVRDATGRASIAFPDIVAELRDRVERTSAHASHDEAAADEIDADAPLDGEYEEATEYPGPADGLDAMAAESGEPFDADGLPSTDSPATPRAVRRPQWPRFVRVRAHRFVWRRHARWVAFVVVLFAIGWWVGTRGTSRRPLPSGRAPFPVQVLRALGLASPRFAVRINSNPTGAVITVDGKPSGFRTPAELELPPGARRIGLTLPELGTVTTIVDGKRGAILPLDVALTGSLVVSGPDPATPVSIVLDGESRGFAPLQLAAIAPGAHDLVFTSPGQPSWSQTVTVPVRGEMRIVARPFDLPATGVIHVGSTFTDDEGSSELKDAAVLIDGERRGVTPLTIELPRGPHSLRAEYAGESVPIQVIDLPGGNERFASFSFGLGTVFPKLVLQSPLGPISRSVTTPVTVSMQGLSTRDVREVWLHVKAQDGAWTRYPMDVVPGGSGPAATVIFPTSLLDARGAATFYVSALVSTGEEYFTDIVGGGGANPTPRGARKTADAAYAPTGRIRITPTPATSSTP